MIIGLTGGLATGKTTIARLLTADGYTIIDADKITHELYETNQEAYEIVKKICPVAAVDRRIDRGILAREITADPALLPQLEADIHPLIIRVIQNRLQEADTGFKPVILVVPALFETGLNRLCAHVICLYAALETQRIRALERPTMTAEKFDILIARQWTNEQRCVQADLNVSTEHTIEQTYQEVRSFLKQFETPAH